MVRVKETVRVHHHDTGSPIGANEIVFIVRQTFGALHVQYVSEVRDCRPGTKQHTKFQRES